jgi:pimeloyl-ACP methyl ester carboxylesterase
MKLFAKILLSVVVVLSVGIGYWLYDSEDRMHRVTPEALAALQSDAAITVSQEQWIVFTPATSTPTKGLIFYPGGECDERGYAEPLREIAAAGYLVVLVPMPMQLAVFAPDSATEVIAEFPEIQSWAIAGHSLGGSMAARYAHHHPDNIDGLLLWDAYAPDDMTGSNAKIMMVHRSDASGAVPADYVTKLPLLPEQTEFVPLQGAQHLNYGRFIAGRLYRDEPVAELDPDEHRALAATASISFMDAL